MKRFEARSARSSAALGIGVLRDLGLGAALPRPRARRSWPQASDSPRRNQLGPVSPAANVSGAVVLEPRDGGALTRFISQVTDKHSPLFHHVS